ncbi:MAG: hypothetical protein ABIV39_12870, partial [Verrucomicrobiota bacterium]
MNHGDRREAIFLDDQDRDYFWKRCVKVVRKPREEEPGWRHQGDLEKCRSSGDCGRNDDDLEMDCDEITNGEMD